MDDIRKRHVCMPLKLLGKQPEPRVKLYWDLSFLLTGCRWNLLDFLVHFGFDYFILFMGFFCINIYWAFRYLFNFHENKNTLKMI